MHQIREEIEEAEVDPHCSYTNDEDVQHEQWPRLILLLLYQKFPRVRESHSELADEAED